MAERERKSKPRKLEPVEEDEGYNWWQLATYLVAGVGVILVMVIVSKFLSGTPEDIAVWLYVSLGGTVVVAAVFWLLGWLSTREK